MSKKKNAPTPAPPAKNPAGKPKTLAEIKATPSAPKDYTNLHKALLISFLVIGFIIRIINLDGLSLWVDEYVHVDRAKFFLMGKDHLFTNDNNGILYTFFILPFFKIFGSTAFWARFPAVLMGTGSIYLLYRLGKRLFNPWVGLTAAFFSTFSLYLVYWSRLSRNYSIFEFFFLLLLLCFVLAFDNKVDTGSTNFFAKQGINKKYLFLLPLALVGSLLSHQLTFMFIFGGMIWLVGVAIHKIITEKSFNNVFTWLAVPSLILCLLIFTPAFAPVTRSILSLFLPPNAVNWVVVDWTRISKLYAEEKLKAFDIYWGMLTYDYGKFYVLGLLGLVAAFFVRTRSALFLTASTLVPFLLLSFIFREPSLPRYFIFVYPLLLISAAVCIYTLVRLLNQRVFAGNGLAGLRSFMWISPVIILLPFIRFKELKSLLSVELKSGFVIDRALSQWSFTNWSDPVSWVKKNIKPGDLVMTTVPTAVNYYMNLDSTIWFRQRNYNGIKKEYEFNPIKNDGKSAGTYEDLVKTVETNPRGWLIADYYLTNAMTDPRARDYVYKNFQFHFDATKDGSVQVFSWDHAVGPPKDQNIIIELGKNPTKQASEELSISLDQSALQPGLKLYVKAQGINFNNEAYVIFNQKYTVPIPPNKTNGIEDIAVDLDISKLKPGANTVQIAYNYEMKYDPVKGFVLYKLGLGR